MLHLKTKSVCAKCFFTNIVLLPIPSPITPSFPAILTGFVLGLKEVYALVHPESIRGKQVLAQMAVNREKKAAAKQRKEAKQKEQEEAKQQDEDPDSLDENDDSDEENEDGLNQEFVNSPPAAVAADNSSPEMNVEQWSMHFLFSLFSPSDRTRIVLL